jgi:hypothetical protein
LQEPKGSQLFFAAFSLWLSSCGSLYVPNKLTVPLFDHKHEFEISCNIGSNGADVQTAYAVSDNWFILANANVGLDQFIYQNDLSNKHLFLDGGIGYYKNIDDFQNLSISFGYGRGTSDKELRMSGFYVVDYNYNASGNVQRVFIQPTYAIKHIKNKSVQLYMSCRISGVHYYNYTIQHSYSEKLINNRLFFEPAIGYSVGGNKIRIHTQYGLSFPTMHNFDAFGHRLWILSTGLILRI